MICVHFKSGKFSPGYKEVIGELSPGFKSTSPTTFLYPRFNLPLLKCSQIIAEPIYPSRKSGMSIGDLLVVAPPTSRIKLSTLKSLTFRSISKILFEIDFFGA